MSLDVLIRIKRLVVRGQVMFTVKAESEMEIDHLTEDLVCESILNAPAIAKILSSGNPRTGLRERLNINDGLTYDDLPVYTKGKLVSTSEGEKFYVLISSKKARG